MRHLFDASGLFSTSSSRLSSLTQPLRQRLSILLAQLGYRLPQLRPSFRATTHFPLVAARDVEGGIPTVLITKLQVQVRSMATVRIGTASASFFSTTKHDLGKCARKSILSERLKPLSVP